MKPERTIMDDLIYEHLHRFGENNLFRASLDHFRETGQTSGSFRSALHAMMEEYRQSSHVESKWVYGINSGCRYEGGGVRGSLYATEELVRVKFNELLQEKEEEYRGMCEHFGEEYKYKWKKEERTSFMEYWSNGVDYIAIDKMQVLTELPIEETKEK